MRSNQIGGIDTRKGRHEIVLSVESISRVRFFKTLQDNDIDYKVIRKETARPHGFHESIWRQQGNYRPMPKYATYIMYEVL